MNAKQKATLYSLFCLMLSSGAYANNQSNRESNPMCYERGAPLCPGQFCPTYNLPGSIQLDCSNDVYATASFIYWMASTEGLNFGQYRYPYLGTVAQTDAFVDFGLTGDGGGVEKVQPSKFRPGFKVGLGYTSDFDDWTAYLEYTWLHQNTKETNQAPFGDVVILSGSPVNVAGDFLSQKWHLNLDMGDFDLSRTYYVGRRLTLEPVVGIRAAWIRQKLSLNLSTTPGTPFDDFADRGAVEDIIAIGEQSVATCNSWGLGPKIGLHSEWLLGCGVRVDAKASGSLLFTRYTELSIANTLNFASGATTTPSLRYSSSYNTMRPNAELGLGLGWGMYTCRRDYHFDLSATYDFNIFWSQTKLRSLVDELRSFAGSTATDLVYHGPTFTARLDF